LRLVAGLAVRFTGFLDEVAGALIQPNPPLEALSTDPKRVGATPCPEGWKIYSASGGHRDMFKEPHVKALADNLAADGFCYQAITRFDRWSSSAIAIFHQLSRTIGVIMSQTIS